MNGTTKIILAEATERAKGKKGKAYVDAINAAFTPEKIAKAKPENYTKEKKGKLK